MNLLSQTIDFLDKYSELPIFTVKIGICSPQVENVILEEALEEYERVGGSEPNAREYIEYPYIFVRDFVKDSEKINEYLKNMGLQ